MIADRDQFTVTSTMPATAQRTAMGIRAEDMSHIMGVLTDLYSNKIRAMIREYTTNGRDAQVEAGVTRPIEVTLPGALAPFLRVRDFGTGLSVDEIHEVYSQYGRSTKRATNDAVGMLGLGCKSALTYCSQFTVTSVKDGTKVVVSVTREDDGSGSMTVVDTLKAHDEPNGTEVTIPINRQDCDRCGTEAADFFSVWPKGSVLVNGQEPKQFEGLYVAEGLYVTQERESRVVMGNVAYPAPWLNGLCPMGGILAFVPIGSVNFPPSRESLMDTKTTRATIDRIKATFTKEVVSAVQREVNKTDSPSEAIRTMVKWRQYIPGFSYRNRQTYTFKGKTLPATMAHPDGGAFIVSSVSSYGRPGSSGFHAVIPVDAFPQTVWVENFTPLKYTAQHKHKMVKYCEQQGITIATGHQFACTAGVLMKHDAAMEFIDHKTIIDWEDVRQIKLQPKSQRGPSGRIPGSYDLWTEDGFKSGVPGDEIRQNLPIFYVVGRWNEGTRYHTALLALDVPKFTVVVLGANRLGKFQRNVPAAKDAAQGVKEAGERKVAGFSDDERKALSLADGGHTRDLCRLAGRKLNDPELVEAIRLADTVPTQNLRNLRRTLSRSVPLDALTIDQPDPFAKYPLLEGGIYGHDIDHAVAYFNWVHGGCK